MLKLFNAKGSILAEADDTPGLGKDPRLEWTAPADGGFVLSVGDLHSRGGDEFGYVLTAEPRRARLHADLRPRQAQRRAWRACPPVRPGDPPRGLPRADLLRRRPAPPGVSASPLTIGPTSTQGVIVVSADPTAKAAASLLTVQGRGETPAGPLARLATPKQEIYMPGGGRGIYPVTTVAVGVTDAPTSPSKRPRSPSRSSPAAPRRSTSR